MEDKPKNLKFESERLERGRRLLDEHIAPLTRFVERMRREHPDKIIPYFDPLDGGTNAECLCVLEAPGKMTRVGGGSGFISRNNDDNSASNFFKMSKEVGISRHRTVLWNIVPWYLGTYDERGRPTLADIDSGFHYLCSLIELLPRITVIALFGEKARSVESRLRNTHSYVSIFVANMPSPSFINRNRKTNWATITAVLKDVKNSLGTRRNKARRVQ